MLTTSILPPSIYFEAHITIEPILEEERLQQLKTLCFKVADLLFQKRKSDSPKRSSKDSFCTGRDKNFESLKEKMTLLVEQLRCAGFKVWRQKIENVILDEKFSKI